MSKNFFLTFLYCMRLFLEGLSQIIYGILYWNYESEKLPPIKNLLLIESATSLALKIRKRKITSEEVTRAYIERMKLINPMLNAVVDERFEEAIKEAKMADKLLRTNPEILESLEKEKPFFGVPTTIKECMQVTGLRQTVGLYCRKDFVSSEDADCVKLMKAAGAIVMAVTNVPEACMWWETFNTIYGRTNNAYNLGRFAGGSSGGEAVNLAACGSPMGVGSDIGGSIRIPAYFNGVFGHKASPGIVSNKGMEPVAVGEHDTYLSTGPMCRFAADLKPMLKVMASSNVHLLSLDKKVNLRYLKVYYMEDDMGNAVTTPVDKELRRVITRTTDHFRSTYNVQCEKLKLTDFKRSAGVFFSKMSGESKALPFCRVLSDGKENVKIWTETAKWMVGMSYHTAPALAFGLMEKLANAYKSPTQYLSANRGLDNLKQTLKEKLSDNAVFLYPPHPTEAGHHYQSLFRPFNFVYTSIFNMLGFPATVCPVGLNRNGLPLGIQVIAAPNQDHLCLAMAEEIERVFGGWVCPSEIE